MTLGEFIACLTYKTNDENFELMNDSFEKEVEFLSNIKHLNIVKLKGSMKLDKKMYVFLERGNISLTDHLADYRLFSKGKLKEDIKILKDVISAILHMHNLRYINMDLKPDNVVLFFDKENRTITAKLIDFTSYLKIPEDSDFVSDKFLRGTLFYIDPSLLFCENDIRFSKENDIYSFGVLMYELLNSTQACSEYSEFICDQYECKLDELDSKLEKDETDFESEFMDDISGRGEYLWRPSFKDYILENLDKFDSKELKTSLVGLVYRCWDSDQTKRPTANEIYEELIRVEERLNQDFED